MVWLGSDTLNVTKQSVGGIRGLAPCVDGSELARAFFTLQGWSVQPMVSPSRADEGRP